MLTILTTAGAAAILNSRASGNKIKFVAFQIGLLDGPLQDYRGYQFPGHPFGQDEVTNPDLQWLANSFESRYEGDEAQITYLQISQVGTVLKCYTPKDTDYWRFNAVILYAEYQGVRLPFSYSYYMVDNPKFSVEQTGGGMRHYFMMQIRAANRDSLFDYSNLVIEVPTFSQHDDWYGLEPARENPYDQLILHSHPNFEFPGAPDTEHLVINSVENFFGVPMRQITIGAAGQSEYRLLDRKPMIEKPSDPTLQPEGWVEALDADGNQIFSRDGRVMLTRG